MQIPLSRPDITDLERDAVNEVLLTSDLALGPKLREFERRMAAYHDRKHAIAVNSGTSALHLAMLALGLERGDEVITTPFTFIASTNCILYPEGRPRYVDIDPENWNLDVGALESALTPRTVGLLPVHVFGVPYDTGAVRDFADRHGLWIVEDACEAIGAWDRRSVVGKNADVSVLAFYPNKQITTGEGGLLMTDDDRIAAHCRSLRNQGRGEGPGWLAHERLGYNYRMSDISAALGIAQLSRIDEILSRRAAVAELYRERLADIPWLSLQAEPESAGRSWFVFVIALSEEFGREDRDRMMDLMRGRGIGCSNYFPPVHLQPFLRERFGFEPGSFPVCESLSERTIALPFFNGLKPRQVDVVCSALRETGEAILEGGSAVARAAAGRTA